MQALLVLDVMEAIFELPVPLHDPAGFVRNLRGLLDRARAARIPIFHFQQLGADGTRFARGAPGRRFHASATPLPGEHVIEKSEPDMFFDTPLAALLADAGVTRLVICGFASEACVDTTVRSAWARRFDVTLAAGAHTTTANAVLTAEQVVRHHELVLTRFARVIPADQIAFAPAQ